MCIGLLLVKNNLCDKNLDVTASVRKYARTIASDEKSIAELKREEKSKEKVCTKPPRGRLVGRE